MNISTRNYTLRYGETAGNEMTVMFEVGAVLRDNLERVIPLAIDKQLVSPDCTPETLRVSYNDKVLNLQLPLEEQVPDIPEYALIVAMDRAAKISVRFRYKPDHLDEKSQVVELKPDDAFEGQLSPLLNKLRAEHRFRGVRRKAWRIYEGRRRLSMRKSPSSQGIRSGSEVRVVPWAIVGWPPAVFEYTMLVVVLLACAGYVVYRWWPTWFPPPPITHFTVWFQSDVDCRVEAADTVLIQLKGGVRDSVTVKAGGHDLLYFPRGFPISTGEITLSPTAKSDTVSMPINIEDIWKGKAELMTLNVYGFYETESTRNRIRENILINGFPYEVDKQLPELVVPDLYRGTYDIRFDLPEEQCMWDKTKWRTGKIFRTRESEFWFDFSRYDSEYPALIIFYYKRPDK
jgi:hypothetical protein